MGARIAPTEGTSRERDACGEDRGWKDRGEGPGAGRGAHKSGRGAWSSGRASEIGAPKEALSASGPRPEPHARAPFDRHPQRESLSRLSSGHPRSQLDDPARRSLGGARCERFRQVHLAERHLRRPASGAGRIDRARRSAATAHASKQWKRRIGWVSPELQADHHLAKSLEEIVISGRYASIGLNEPPTKTDRSVARRWLRFFHIDHLRERAPRQASYGQMRLALIARAMANDPELLLLDEPCTGLDADIRADVLALIEQLARRGTQLIMAVHDPEDIVPAVKRILRIGRGGRGSGHWRRRGLRARPE